MHKLLIVNDNGCEGSPLVKRLNGMGYSCSSAHSYDEAKTLISAEHFDVVLCKLSMNDGTAYELRPMLAGRPSSLFYSLSVDEDCWWIPGVRNGRQCLGEAALRPDDFFNVLEKITLLVQGEGSFGASSSRH